jgi:hypothetical protein
MSQLLLRIDLALKTERDSVRRAELFARRAGYLARIGKFEESKQIIVKLRETFGDGRSGRATVWIMIAEALISLFERLSPDSLDRISRAQLLARAMEDKELFSIASAWKAHYEFETSDFSAMLASVRLARDNAEEQNLDALTRLSMVLCNAFLICGDKANAVRWFGVCRNHATIAGDQASTEALLYNRAAFSVARLRTLGCLEREIGSDLAFARRDVSNALNFQALTQVAALTNFVHLSDARLLILERKHDEAIEKLNAVRTMGPFACYNFSESLVELEVAYCHFMEDRHEMAHASLRDLVMDDFSHLDVDERLVAARMLLDMSKQSVGIGSPDSYQQVFAQLSREYEIMTLELHTELTRLTAEIE